MIETRDITLPEFEAYQKYFIMKQYSISMKTDTQAKGIPWKVTSKCIHLSLGAEKKNCRKDTLFGKCGRNQKATFKRNNLDPQL